MKVKKQQPASARGQDLLNRMKVPSKHTVSQYSATKKVDESIQQKYSPIAKQKKSSKIPKPATVEEATASDEEMLGPASNSTRQTKASKTVLRSGEFLKLLESTPSAPEDLEGWMEKHGINDNGLVNMVEEKCSTLAKLIRMSKSPKAMPNKACLATLEEVDQFYIHRNKSRSISILYPLEIFKGIDNRAISKHKVLGFVRSEGSPCPLMYSISGYTDCLMPHDLLLNTDEWSQQVFKFGNFHGHRFHTDGWDREHGKVHGAAAAAHVEPKLMLFYACRVLGKFHREFKSIDQQVGRLDKLKNIVQRMKSSPTAEILLSRAPCQPCKNFQELVEDISGVKFTVRVCKVLAQVALKKDQSGRDIYPTCAEDSDTEDAAHQEDLRRMLRRIEGLEIENRRLKALPATSSKESDSEASMIEEVQKSQLQVIVPFRRLTDSTTPRTPKRKSKPTGAKITTNTATKTMHRTSKVTTSQNIHDIQKKSRKRGYNSEDDEDYEEPGSHRHSTKRKSPRSELSSPTSLRREFEMIDLDSDFEDFERAIERRESFTSLAKRLTYPYAK